ncbi:ABC transporter permease [Thiolapillus brandeum]|uniref:Antimicrobial peptide ABC transporter permease n=1 Tax=Thiolapillus brandeum TaxID=1076588 RepID=A0A7U6GL20_9GAMM|nr:ABC transporter permease [Thiolapillus brandeum]BAO45632.1 antimicrobial peptide ABC transporter permease [Thiolapillus brandeum]
MRLQARDVMRFSWGALSGYPSRALLMLLAMSIGVASVVMLTALGEGARRYVKGEFASLGTNLLMVLPGRSETAGFDPSTLMGETPRALTLDDAAALRRSRLVRRVSPLNIGSVEVSRQGRLRDTVIMGGTRELLEIRHWHMGQGRFLPGGRWRRARSVAVIGRHLKQELFGTEPAVGQWLRIGDRRFRVIGVLASEGRSIGVDVQDVVIIPTATAQQLFNTESLFRILVEASSRGAIAPARDFIIRTLQARHQGVKDVTVITQDAVLATFDRILGALTYSVGGIAAISLVVAGILIMNVMLVAVSQRTAEIGLLKALGADRREILSIFVGEALLLSSLGAMAGLILGEAGALVLRQAFPVLPAHAPSWAVGAALAVALGTGVVFSLLPARRAAALDPVTALSGR